MISSQLNDIAGIYLRLSNEDEKIGESGSITNQREILKKYAKDNALRVVEEYIDDGFSGTSFDRPSFKRMLEDIKRNKINVVITKDMSRLGREHIETCFYIEKFFPENNVRYISVLDGLDTSIDNGISDITPFKAVINDMYAKDISKKVRSAKRSRAEAGKYMGTYAPYGYKKSPEDKNKLIIDEDVAPVVKKIFELGARGVPPMKISYILNDENIVTPSEIVGNKHARTNEFTRNGWKYSVIARMLQNELYIGNLTMGKTRKLNYKSKKILQVEKDSWIISKNTHEAIIDEKTFDQVQIHVNNRRGTKTKTYDVLLKGLLSCKECGKKLSVIPYTNKGGKMTLYFRCNTYAVSPKSRYCTPHTANADKLTQAIIDAVKDRCRKYIDESSIIKISEIKKSVNVENNKDKELDNLNKQIKILNIKIDKIYDDKLNDLLKENDFQRLYNTYTLQRIGIEEKVKLLANKKVEQVAKIDVNKITKKFLSMEDISRTMLAMLVSKVEMSQDKQIYIHYKFNELN